MPPAVIIAAFIDRKGLFWCYLPNQEVPEGHGSTEYGARIATTNWNRNYQQKV
jgi:hypothetical protein